MSAAAAEPKPAARSDGSEELMKQLEAQNAELKKKLEDSEKQMVQLSSEREDVIELMTGEGVELLERIERLNKDKDALNSRIAETLAKSETEKLEAAHGSALENRVR